MSSAIKLSFVLTTFNKLDYLKVVLPLLIDARKSDEEIIIVDGGSSDGTSAHLKSLYDSGKIQGFISEKDRGEAHGTNKGFLMARGELIKIITDDDVFSFKIINDCKEFMLKNPEIDIMGFDGFGNNLSKEKLSFVKSKYIEGYKEWLVSRTPFLFCGLSFMIRRSSLAYLGLFNTKFTMVDMEYSLRVSSLNANIAFHTGLGFVGIANPNSNSVKFNKLLEVERKKVQDMYFPEGNTVSYAHIKKNIFGLLAKIKHGLKHTKENKKQTPYVTAVKESVKMLEKESAKTNFEILRP